MRRRTRRLLHAAALADWWQARAALNERLAALTDELSADSSPEVFSAALDEVRRLNPLFTGAPDAELDRLNRARRDTLARALEAAEAGELGLASDRLDDHIAVTDEFGRRLESLLRKR